MSRNVTLFRSNATSASNDQLIVGSWSYDHTSREVFREGASTAAFTLNANTAGTRDSGVFDDLIVTDAHFYIHPVNHGMFLIVTGNPFGNNGVFPDTRVRSAPVNTVNDAGRNAQLAAVFDPNTTYHAFAPNGERFTFLTSSTTNQVPQSSGNVAIANINGLTGQAAEDDLIRLLGQSVLQVTRAGNFAIADVLAEGTVNTSTGPNIQTKWADIARGSFVEIANSTVDI